MPPCAKTLELAIAAGVELDVLDWSEVELFLRINRLKSEHSEVELFLRMNRLKSEGPGVELLLRVGRCNFWKCGAKGAANADFNYSGPGTKCTKGFFK